MGEGLLTEPPQFSIADCRFSILGKSEIENRKSEMLLPRLGDLWLSKVSSRWVALGLALPMVVGAVLRLAPIGANRFHEDEALYSFWALQVATGRDPILNHSPVDKPPLFIYTLALCFKLFGPSEVVARLPSELSSMASIALTYCLAWQLYGRAVAMVAAVLMALSPFNILFAPTAFTDPLMVAWVLASLCLAANDNFGGSGLMLGLAAATKQQGLFFLPLAIIIGVRCRKPPPPTSGKGSTLPPQGWGDLREGLSFILGFLAVMAPVAWWDSLRWRLQPNYLEQSLISYGGLTLVDPARLVERLGDWAELLHYITASPILNLLLLGGLPCLLLYDLRRWGGESATSSLARTSAGSATGVQGRARLMAALRLQLRPLAIGTGTFFDVALSGFLIVFLLAHWVLSFNVWDRYLLGLVPLLLILLARIIWLATGALAHLISDLTGSVRARFSISLRGFFAVLLLAATLTGPALKAARSGYPIGGDHGAYDGIEAVAEYFRDHVPAGSILYHHWLGWHYSFYMFDFPLVFRWYPSPEELAEDASQIDGAQRYIVFPSGKLTSAVTDALAEAGLTLHRVYRTHRRDGSTSFTVYQIRAQK